jgi:xanthine dehydrogenase YagS FAD-binding subunit
MKNFEHADAETIEEAIGLLEGAGNTRIIAGGTDLLSRMKAGIDEPDRLVNLKTIRGLNNIVEIETGLNIGALATLDAVASDAAVSKQYSILAQAIGQAASPQLRTAGTIGGNLCQNSRCWYYRGQFPCWLKHGDTCYAKDGENKDHAIFGGGPCFTAHPSDTAPALIALGAEITVEGPEGSRTMPVEDLFQLPNDDSRQLTVLKSDEIITGIHIPRPAERSVGIYLKAMERRVWSFAQASVAIQISFRGQDLKDARAVLGGVAPMPWRLPRLESYLRNEGIYPRAITGASDIAVAGAQPLSHTRYKIPLIRALVSDALTRLANH